MRRTAVALLAATGLFLAGPSAAAEDVRPGEDVQSFGDAGFEGSPGSETLTRSIVAMAATPSGDGYWLVTTAGEVLAHGDAAEHGDLVAIDLAAPITGIAPTPTGDGYWLAATDGGVFSFGDATFHGSAGAIDLAAPITGIAPTPTGDGYWLAATDGGVFSFGDATFHGSAGAIDLAAPITGIAPTPTGDGYWLAATDGGVFSFGDATFHGSAGAIDLAAPITGIAPTPTGDGYWLAATDGGVFDYGGATFHGSAADDPVDPVVAIAAAPGGGFWLATINVRECRADEFVIAYPADWHEAGGAVPPCSYLDRQPTSVSGHAAIRTTLAVAIRTLPRPFAEASSPDADMRELSRSTTSVDGHRAVVTESIATGEGRLPRGTFRYEYLVDLGRGDTLAAATYDVEDGVEQYRADKAVLDDIMGSMDVLDR